ncbi:MAG: hypothetical protein CMJ64_30360 [Planctomycetaceae bacterium]|nr:hypothetical protein [Planctomycetaceae bacterium]
MFKELDEPEGPCVSAFGLDQGAARSNSAKILFGEAGCSGLRVTDHHRVSSLNRNRDTATGDCRITDHCRR